VLSGRGLCDELITRPEESYRLCCVVVCDLETSRMGAPYIYDICHLRVKKQCIDLSWLIPMKWDEIIRQAIRILPLLCYRHVSLSWVKPCFSMNKDDCIRNLRNDKFDVLYVSDVGRDSSVSIVTGYGLDGPGIESQWRRDFPHLSTPALGPTQPPVEWVPGLSRG